MARPIRHATPRTVTSGDQALYQALYGSRFAVQSVGRHSPAPSAITRRRSTIFSSSTSCSASRCRDISLNAVANLGYADCRFLKPVYPGDTLSAQSDVIGLKENSNGKTGTVYVRTQRPQSAWRGSADLCALGDGAEARRRPPGFEPQVPDLPRRGGRRARFRLPADCSTCRRWDAALAGCPIASATTKSANASTISTA